MVKEMEALMCCTEQNCCIEKFFEFNECLSNIFLQCEWLRAKI